MILISLWLPIQAAAAVTMPFCRQTTVQVVAAAAHCHEQAAEQAPASSPDDLACDDCSICHLACSGFLLAAVATSPAFLMASVLVPKLQPALTSHISAPPQRPPRR